MSYPLSEFGKPHVSPNKMVARNGGFLKWGYPQSSSISMEISTLNHPAIGVAPFMEPPTL